MTPKEKAEELVNEFRILLINNSDPMRMIEPFNYKSVSEQCALICVDEIINELIELDKYEHVPQHLIEEWRNVRKELKKL